MKQKTFIKASCIYNIHTGEIFFCSCYFWRFVSRFDSNKETKLEVCFGSYEFSLLFIFSQAFSKHFAKITCDLPLYGLLKNLIISFAEAFWYFSDYQFTTLLPFLSKLLISFFQGNLPVVVSANTCLKVTPKNLK